MDNFQNNMMPNNESSENKKSRMWTWFIIAVVLFAGILWWWLEMYQRGSQSSQPLPIPVVDENADITKDLGNIDISTPDFNSIDQDINGL